MKTIIERIIGTLLFVALFLGFVAYMAFAGKREHESKEKTAFYEIRIIEGEFKGTKITDVIYSDTLNINDTVKFDVHNAVIKNKFKCHVCNF